MVVAMAPPSPCDDNDDDIGPAVEPVMEWMVSRPSVFLLCEMVPS